jgi:hypothetical protein
LIILIENAQAISTHFRLTTSHSNRRNACALCADALLEFGSFVRGGDWKCRAYYVLHSLLNATVKLLIIIQTCTKRDKNIKFLCISWTKLYGKEFFFIFVAANVRSRVVEDDGKPARVKLKENHSWEARKREIRTWQRQGLQQR